MNDLPDKKWFNVPEVATMLATILGVTVNASRIRIYKRIGSGEIVVRSFAGATRISREQVIKIVEGEVI